MTSTTFDQTTPGFLDADGDLTAVGEAALDAHLETVNAALQTSAAEHGVTVELTDHALITGPDGLTVTAGGADDLTESPAQWVAYVTAALEAAQA
ncbi:hypothetical protein AB2L57_10750 [Microbacterium sp. HA-8]|uniref:hypothetical protein n=1 Tax=Microbacterium sp. HA-8 TaxID=3234200 RepID=UPI0038F6D0C0